MDGCDRSVDSDRRHKRGYHEAVWGGSARLHPGSRGERQQCGHHRGRHLGHHHQQTTARQWQQGYYYML